jgi:DNA polymerase-3 subunit gamma/tau
VHIGGAVNLAEKMRPSTLDEIIGNTHIVSALKKQFETNTLSQTIMFTGEPGSGKTSFAKIIASHLDAEILEIDCGADGSIDNMREIVESVSLSSLFSKNKVFILDEIHALSKPGQSALLKTLEEPQKNVHFILLTTDPQKVLNTIRTRCVEYQTTPASTEEIGEAVRRVEKKFGISFENRTDLWSLVEQSKGSLRQVYAFMEKLVAVADERNFITSDMFYKTLGKSMEHVDENLPMAFLNYKLHEALSIIGNLRKEVGNPTGTLIGVYNYLKIVFIKNPDSIKEKQKLLMADLSEKIASKEITWDTLEHLVWKHL